LQENTGFAAANNLAVQRAADCEWVALLNPDAFADPDWLKHLAAAADRNPEYAFFGSRMTSHPDTGLLDGTGDVYHVSGLAWRRHHGRRPDASANMTGEVFAPCAAAAFYRREVFLQAGGFDESYFCYFEDVDLAFRLRLLGHRCLYIPNAIVAHAGSASLGKHSGFSIYHGHRNLVWAYFKNMPWPLILLYLPQHLLFNAAALIWFSLTGCPKIIFGAKWDALKGLPRVLRQRGDIQRKIKIHPDALRRVMAKGWLQPFLKR
jgi:GT2 family glycosyltransferase